MNTLELKYAEFKSYKPDETDDLIIKGYPATFNTEDSLGLTMHPELKKKVLTRDIIHEGAFIKTLTERKSKVLLCLNHKTDNPIGKILELKEDSVGLYLEGMISNSEVEVKTKIREEVYNDMSIQFLVTKATMEQKNDGTWIRHIYEMKLRECSVVSEGRHPDSKITERKSIDEALLIIENIYKDEKDENKRYKLLELKSLIEGEPEEPLIPEEPKKEEVKSLFSNFQFE